MESKEYVLEFNNYFENFISKPKDNSTLGLGMIYATVDGGKRIRPLGVYLGARAIKGILDDETYEMVQSLGTVLELIHSYSLVHDDLPAMDNDEYRRGKLSTWKKFGHANGILIGDYLLSESYKKAIEDAKKFGLTYLDAANEIINAAIDMVDGQVLDLSGMKTEDEYLYMYSKKTGALFRAAFMSGAIVAKASEKELSIVKRYAEHLGLAFQIADDLLDSDDDNSIIKAIGKDSALKMLDDNTRSAVACAHELKFGAQLEELAKKLEYRKY